MSFAEQRYFGLRLALWYATLFVVGAIAIVYLTYYVTAASLAQRDQQILQAKLGEYATVYSRGGMRGLVDTVQAEQRTAPERLYVRVVDQGREAVLLSMPEGWAAETLETRSVRLRDRIDRPFETKRLHTVRGVGYVLR